MVTVQDSKASAIDVEIEDAAVVGVRGRVALKDHAAESPVALQQIGAGGAGGDEDRSAH